MKRLSFWIAAVVLLLIGSMIGVSGLVYVAPQEMLVLTRNYGRGLPEGKVLAEPGEVGIQKNVLGPGCHWIVPLLYKTKKYPVLEVPAGKVGIVTAKYGARIPGNRFLAEDGEVGIRRRVLGPGTYRLNPFGFDVEIVAEVAIPLGSVGVLINNQKGGVVKERVLHPGTHYINPRQYRVELVNTGINEYTISGNIQPAITDEMLTGDMEQETFKHHQEAHLKAGAISFPSRDGFNVGLDVTVLWELNPQNAVGAVDAYGNVRELVDRVINPKLNSACRNVGSEYSAKQMVQGDTRAKFQQDFTDLLREYVIEAPLRVLTTLPRGVYVPLKIQLPIMQTQIKQEQMLTNVEIEETSKMEAKLEEQKKLVVQEIEQVKAATNVLRRSIQMDTTKQVGEYEAETRLQVSRIDLNTQKLETQIADILSIADAEVNQIRGQKQAELNQIHVKAFGGAQNYQAYLVATESLPESRLPVRIIHAGEGTLWTDLDKTAGQPLLFDLFRSKAKE